jgi:hypothetical protein
VSPALPSLAAREAAAYRKPWRAVADRQSFAEVKVTGYVEEHDLQTKLKAIRRLVTKEEMVKISIYHKRGQKLDKAVRAGLHACAPAHLCMPQRSLIFPRAFISVL